MTLNNDKLIIIYTQTYKKFTCVLIFTYSAPQIYSLHLRYVQKTFCSQFYLNYTTLEIQSNCFSQFRHLQTYKFYLDFLTQHTKL